MEILRRGRVLKNVLIFIPLSYWLLFCLYSLNYGTSFLNLNSFKNFFLGTYPIALLMVLSLWPIYQAKKISYVLLILIYLSMVLVGLKFFSLSENKLILFGLFIYLVVGFNMVQIYKLELDEPIYSPLYTKNQLELDHWFPLNVLVTNEQGEQREGKITNWSEQALFIYFKDFEFSKNIQGKLKVSFNWDKNIFETDGTVATRYYSGCGLELGRWDRESSQQGRASWEELLKIFAARRLGTS